MLLLLLFEKTIWSIFASFIYSKFCISHFVWYFTLDLVVDSSFYQMYALCVVIVRKKNERTICPINAKIAWTPGVCVRSEMNERIIKTEIFKNHLLQADGLSRIILLNTKWISQLSNHFEESEPSAVPISLYLFLLHVFFLVLFLLNSLIAKFIHNFDSILFQCKKDFATDFN